MLRMPRLARLAGLVTSLLLCLAPTVATLLLASRLAQAASPPTSVAQENQIIFITNRDSNREIYVMDADGSNPVNLTNNEGMDEAITWSPDGSKIAFVSNRELAGEIYVMNADGSNPV